MKRGRPRSLLWPQSRRQRLAAPDPLLPVAPARRGRSRITRDRERRNSPIPQVYRASPARRRRNAARAPKARRSTKEICAHSERVGTMAAAEGGGGGGGAAPVVTARPTGPLIPVAAPLSVRNGAVLPLALLLYTVMELVVMVFPTNSSLLVRSSVRGWGPTNPVAAPTRVRSGAVLPLAVRSKTGTELLPALTTNNSLVTRSTPRPMGANNPVAAPPRLRNAGVLPLAVRP